MTLEHCTHFSKIERRYSCSPCGKVYTPIHSGKGIGTGGIRELLVTNFPDFAATTAGLDSSIFAALRWGEHFCESLMRQVNFVSRGKHNRRQTCWINHFCTIIKSFTLANNISLKMSYWLLSHLSFPNNTVIWMSNNFKAHYAQTISSEKKNNVYPFPQSNPRLHLL